jgi:hypothetical protein
VIDRNFDVMDGVYDGRAANFLEFKEMCLSLPQGLLTGAVKEIQVSEADMLTEAFNQKTQSDCISDNLIVCVCDRTMGALRTRTVCVR